MPGIFQQIQMLPLQEQHSACSEADRNLDATVDVDLKPCDVTWEI